MRPSMRLLKILLEINLKEYCRDFGSVFFSFVFPLGFLVSMGVQDSCQQPFTVQVGMVLQAPTASAARLDELLRSDHIFETRRVSNEAGMKALRDGELKILLIFPAEELRAPSAKLQVIADSRTAALAQLAIESGLAQETHPFEMPFQYTLEVAQTRARTDLTFVFPGLLAMAMLQIGLFGTAAPLLRARDRGSLRHLSITPISPFTLISSQLIVRLGIAGLQVTLLIAAGGLWFKGIELSHTGWLALVLVALLGASMLIALGYAVAGWASSQDVGMAIIMIMNFLFIFGGNVFWDVSRAPKLRALMYALPLTYLADIFRQLITGVSGLFAPWTDVLVLLAWTVAAIAVALKTFRFDMDR